MPSPPGSANRSPLRATETGSAAYAAGRQADLMYSPTTEHAALSATADREKRLLDAVTGLPTSPRRWKPEDVALADHVGSCTQCADRHYLENETR